jgi:type 1 fimbriae regulatory protein FimB
MFLPYSQLNILIKELNSAPFSKIKYLTKEEVESFFSQIKNPRDKALLGLVYFYGLRVSEVCLLKLDDIDLKRKRIFVHRVKGGIGGERPLFKNTEKLLRQYLKVRLETGDGLFTGRQGNLKKQRIQQLFKEYAKKIGLDPKYSVHFLRHSIATHLLEAGEGIEFVREHLGHRSIQNTMIYAQITDKGRDEAFRRIEKSPKIARV